MDATVLNERVRRTQDERLSPVVWLNVLCLDAPCVAVVWQALFARVTHAPLRFGDRAALFLTAWLIYLADRFVDARSLRSDSPASVRQRVSLRHRRASIVLIVMVALLEVAAIHALDRNTTLNGAIIGVIAISYLLANAFTRVWHRLPIKEIAIGALFAAGTVLVPLTRGTATAPVWSAAISFAIVCALNCICIAAWERELDAVQGKETLLTRWPGGQKLIVPACVLLAAVDMLAAGTNSCRPLFLCIAGSCALLAVLHATRAHIARDSLTALADLVLLTPVIPLLARM